MYGVNFGRLCFEAYCLWLDLLFMVALIVHGCMVHHALNIEPRTWNIYAAERTWLIMLGIDLPQRTHGLTFNMDSYALKLYPVFLDRYGCHAI
jgi:hypothetical protein